MTGRTPVFKRLGLDLRSFRNVSGLRTLLSLGDLELYLITFLQAFVAFRSNCAVVYKDIGAIVPSDEAVSLSIVKPFYGTFQSFHVRPFGHVLYRRGRTLSFEAIVLPPEGDCQGNASQEKPRGTRVLAPLCLV